MKHQPPLLCHKGRAYPLGSSLTRIGDHDGVNFALMSRHATAVTLCLFDAEGGERRVRAHKDGDNWHVFVAGLTAGQRYGWRVDGENHSGGCFNPNKLLLDPYARALDGKPVLGPELYAHAVDEDLSPTCMPFIPSELDSAGNVALGVVTGEQFPIVPGPKVPEGRTVVYETHVKGFTHDMPDVPPELRGTYAGMAHPAAIEHLVSLGDHDGVIGPVIIGNRAHGDVVPLGAASQQRSRQNDENRSRDRRSAGSALGQNRL